MNDIHELNAPEVYTEEREATFGEVVLELVAGTCVLAFIALVVSVGLIK